MIETYLTSVRKQFAYYKLLGEKTMSQLRDDEFYWQYNNASNSIAIIVKHLAGNMLSRWTDFLTSDGEKEWRQREAEFDNDLPDSRAILAAWNEGWDCLFAALDNINEHNIHTTVYIRNQGHSVIEAIHRQLAHYSYHVGQMVYIGRMIRGDKWTSLSIPRGQTDRFNREKFSQGPHRAHFTDEWLGSAADDSKEDD
jgi:hypothetical protein